MKTFIRTLSTRAVIGSVVLIGLGAATKVDAAILTGGIAFLCCAFIMIACAE